MKTAMDRSSDQAGTTSSGKRYVKSDGYRLLARGEIKATRGTFVLTLENLKGYKRLKSLFRLERKQSNIITTLFSTITKSFKHYSYSAWFLGFPINWGNLAPGACWAGGSVRTRFNSKNVKLTGCRLLIGLCWMSQECVFILPVN